MLKPFLIKLPELLQAKLQTLRAQGFTASGFIRALLERELADVPPTYPGQPPITRKPTAESPGIVREKGRSAPSRKGISPWNSDGKGGLLRQQRKEVPHGKTR